MNPYDAARQAVREAGGLCTPTDLARRWGISQARANALTRETGFPEPVTQHGRTRLYFCQEATEWRDQRLASTDKHSDTGRRRRLAKRAGSA